MSVSYSPGGNTSQRTDTLRVLEVKILNVLNAGGASGGAGAVSQGTGAPSSPPTDPTKAALYTDLATGVIYTWSVVGQAWV